MARSAKYVIASEGRVVWSSYPNLARSRAMKHRQFICNPKTSRIAVESSYILLGACIPIMSSVLTSACWTISTTDR